MYILCTCVGVRMYVRTYETYVCKYVCTYVVCMYVLCVCMYVCMYVCPANPNGFPGTNRNSSHNTEIAPKPPYNNNSRTANQKALAKKMDDRRELLR